MKKKVILLGSSYSALPILFSLKKRGFEVTVCGALKDDPCHVNFPDLSCYLNYADKTKILDFVSDKKFDFVIPSCNDTSYNTASFVAEKLRLLNNGFDSEQVTKKLHTKKLFREVCMELKVEAPKVFEPEGLLEMCLPNGALPFPVIVKPVDSFSGKGVSIARSQTELRNSVKIAEENSNSKQYVIEEFFDGSLHSHSAFIQDGKIFFDCFVDEYCTVYPYQVDCSNHPSILNDSLKAKVRREIEKIAKGLSLVDGLLHTQFLINSNEVRILETMRRAPGDLYGQLIERSIGVPYFDMYTAKFVNQSYIEPQLPTPPKPVLRHTVSIEKDGVGYATTSLPGSTGTFIPLQRSGEELNRAPYGKFGIWFSEFASFKEAESQVKTLSTLHKFEDWQSKYGQ